MRRPIQNDPFLGIELVTDGRDQRRRRAEGAASRSVDAMDASERAQVLPAARRSGFAEPRRHADAPIPKSIQIRNKLMEHTGEATTRKDLAAHTATTHLVTG